VTEAREVEDGRAERGSHPAQGRVGELTFWGRPPMLKKHFEQVWNQLRSKRPQMRNYLERVRIEGLRGIKDLKVVFQYPVSGAQSQEVGFMVATVTLPPVGPARSRMRVAQVPRKRPALRTARRWRMASAFCLSQ